MEAALLSPSLILGLITALTIQTHTPISKTTSKESFPSQYRLHSARGLEITPAHATTVQTMTTATAPTLLGLCLAMELSGLTSKAWHQKHNCWFMLLNTAAPLQEFQTTLATCLTLQLPTAAVYIRTLGVRVLQVTTRQVRCNQT